MPTVVQFRRGTTTQNNNFTGANGEITVDTTVGTLRVHNGVDQGGSNIATTSYVDTAISSLSSNSITDGTSNFAIIATDGNIRGNVGGSTITNIYSGGLEVTGTVSATTFAGTVTTAAQPNITSVGTLSSLNVSGAISAGGTVTGTSFIGVATSAQYADLAENYLADAHYIPGTVMEFGGDAEVTVSTVDHSPAVVGVVSTQPAYLMNSELTGAHPVAIALTGRVPCMVQGPVKKGTVLVSGVVPGTAMAINSLKFEPGCVLGKAMNTIDTTEIKLIEIAVGRL